MVLSWRWEEAELDSKQEENIGQNSEQSFYKALGIMRMANNLGDDAMFSLKGRQKTESILQVFKCSALVIVGLFH